MKVFEKRFESDVLDLLIDFKNQFNEDTKNPKVVNNVYLIFQKLLENKDINGNYMECGVFLGGTLMSAFNFAKQNKINFNFFGVDTFDGFPSVFKHNENDLPNKFKELYNSGLISEKHFKKAKERTKNFSDTSHLEPPYFKSDFSSLFEFCNNNNISLLKGKFKDKLINFNKKINILHIDCDLYDSYLECLNNLYKNLVGGGVVIFDEYYSHKYPGARLAVNEFFVDKKGFFEKYITPDGFERWCFVKGKNK